MDAVKDAVFRALRAVKYPGYSRDIVSFGLVHGVLVEGTTARIGLVIGHLPPAVQQAIGQAVTSAALAVPGVEQVSLQVGKPAQPPAQAGGAPQREPVAGLRHIVAVASGKGGVGKSTVAVNLAVALAQQGLRVGLVDADIHGPNLPRMLGLQSLPELEGGRLQPAVAYGVKVMSMAFLARDGSPVIWRGPMIDKAIRQFFHDVDWGELDMMIVDLPPGTGDAQLSLVQRIPLDGAVIVSTPQGVAWDDALKGLKMFQQMRVPVLGLIENMSYFDCPNCGQHHDIFGSGGAQAEAEKLGLPVLAALPLDPAVRVGGDEGRPAVLDPASRVGQAMRQAARGLSAALAVVAPGLAPA
ncbi:MAG: Mrp/NBP35 family ATP-binding protein [Caldilineaceae bacterium]|nr:Mrp/NBP35 family ATP-binding protein [Caldilineaceae bacterium]